MDKSASQVSAVGRRSGFTPGQGRRPRTGRSCGTRLPGPAATAEPRLGGKWQCLPAFLLRSRVCRALS